MATGQHLSLGFMSGLPAWDSHAYHTGIGRAVTCVQDTRRYAVNKLYSLAAAWCTFTFTAINPVRLDEAHAAWREELALRPCPPLHACSLPAWQDK